MRLLFYTRRMWFHSFFTIWKNHVHFCGVYCTRGRPRRIYWEWNRMRETARLPSDRHGSDNFFEKNIFFPAVQTQDIVQRGASAYYSAKNTIYKRVRVMYNKVTVKSGVVALEGTGIGMLS